MRAKLTYGCFWPTARTSSTLQISVSHPGICETFGNLPGDDASMLIKSADVRSMRVALLENLQGSPKLNRRQKEWACEEVLRLTRGIQGERDAARYLDNHLGDSRN